MTRCFTLRVRSRSLAPTSPAILVIFFMTLVDLLDHLRPDGHAPSAHGLGIGHFGEADAGELAVDQVGAHFPLEHGVAPVARVFENEQAHDHFGGVPATAASAAQAMPLAESLIGG